MMKVPDILLNEPLRTRVKTGGKAALLFRAALRNVMKNV
jgi:hypothetical protein